MVIGGEGLAHPLLRRTGHQELAGWRHWRKLPNLHIRLAPDPLPCRPVRFKASGHRLLLQSLVLRSWGWRWWWLRHWASGPCFLFVPFQSKVPARLFC